MTPHLRDSAPIRASGDWQLERTSAEGRAQSARFEATGGFETEYPSSTQFVELFCRLVLPVFDLSK